MININQIVLGVGGEVCVSLHLQAHILQNAEPYQNPLITCLYVEDTFFLGCLARLCLLTIGLVAIPHLLLTSPSPC